MQQQGSGNQVGQHPGTCSAIHRYGEIRQLDPFKFAVHNPFIVSYRDLIHKGGRSSQLINVGVGHLLAWRDGAASRQHENPWEVVEEGSEVQRNSSKSVTRTRNARPHKDAPFQ